MQFWERLQWARKRAGYKSASAAAKAFGWNENTYKSRDNGVRGMPDETEIKRYARAFGVSYTWLISGEGDALKTPNDRLTHPKVIGETTPTPIKVVGEVAAGVWRQVEQSDVNLTEKETSPFPPDPRFPHNLQFDLIVRGTSINRIARDGQRLRCIETRFSGVEVQSGDLVIVERTRDGGQTVETTAKIVRHRPDLTEFWPDSDDPIWQSPVVALGDVEGEEVRIIAKVLYVYSEIGRR